MRQYLLLLPLFLLFTAPSYACGCYDFKTVEDNIPLYPFIAHVKILEKKENNDTVRKDNTMGIYFHYTAVLTIDILELFKGDASKTIIEQDVHTSCEIGIYPGEEWIIFARYDSATRSYFIGGCFPGGMIRNRKGERGWVFDNTYMITALQKHFKHTVTEEQYDNGVFKNLYVNGNPEWIAEYKDGKLNGNRKVWFADGKLRRDENFVNGKHDGPLKFYNKVGQLIEEGFYQNGLCIYNRKWNDYTVDPDGGHFIKTPEYKGRKDTAWLRRESYSLDSLVNFDCDYYKSGVLKREGYYNHRDGFCLIKNYHKSGKIHYQSTVFWKEKKELYQQWDENGKLEMDKLYINDKLVESKPVQ